MLVPSIGASVRRFAPEWLLALLAMMVVAGCGGTHYQAPATSSGGVGGAFITSTPQGSSAEAATGVRQMQLDEYLADVYLPRCVGNASEGRASKQFGQVSLHGY